MQCSAGRSLFFSKPWRTERTEGLWTSCSTNKCDCKRKQHGHQRSHKVYFLQFLDSFIFCIKRGKKLKQHRYQFFYLFGSSSIKYHLQVDFLFIISDFYLSGNYFYLDLYKPLFISFGEYCTYAAAGGDCDLNCVPSGLAYVFQVQRLVGGFIVTPLDGERRGVYTDLDRCRPVGVHLTVFVVVALELQLQVRSATGTKEKL